LTNAPGPVNCSTGVYINDPGHEVPKDKILVIPLPGREEQYEKHTEVIESLKGNIKRDWFNNHFYYCLPVNIGNQYGFVLKSAYDFDAVWDGSTQNPNDIKVTIYNDDGSDVQNIGPGFAEGVLTVSNRFHLKTPPGVNLMTIQPPNIFIPGMYVMTGVIESDQLRRDFSFNIKFTDPGRVISVKKGDPIAAFIPIPRYFVDQFTVEPANKYFSQELLYNEHNDGNELDRQRMYDDKEKSHWSGRKYFNGEHAFGEPYSDHQKKMDT
jgi:hypothetical protein